MLTPRDWPTFWQSLTAQETAAALQAAPDVALPWSQIGKYWHRKDRDLDGLCLDDDDASTVVEHSDGSAYWSVSHSGRHGLAPDLDSAKSAADAALVAAGWVLL